MMHGGFDEGVGHGWVLGSLIGLVNGSGRMT
jgi:hypothetical protein